jgi:hypothetical protein
MNRILELQIIPVCRDCGEDKEEATLKIKVDDDNETFQMYLGNKRIVCGDWKGNILKPLKKFVNQFK